VLARFAPFKNFTHIFIAKLATVVLTPVRHPERSARGDGIQTREVYGRRVESKLFAVERRERQKVKLQGKSALPCNEEIYEGF